MNANAAGNVQAMGIQNSYGQSRHVNGEEALTLDELESGRKWFNDQEVLVYLAS